MNTASERWTQRDRSEAVKVGSVPEYPIKTNGSTKKETPLTGRRPNDTTR